MVYADKEFGMLDVKKNNRAKCVTFRVKNGRLYITIPPHITTAMLKEIIEVNREQTRKLLEKASKRTFITPSFSLNTSISLQLQPHPYIKTMQSGYKDGVVTLYYPSNMDFHSEEVQDRLHLFIEKVMQKFAMLKILPLLKCYSEKFGLPYSRGKISRSQSCWGSCTKDKNINLSCYLLLLPDHLIEYVIVHELTHTIEMNHSDRFWAMLSQLLKKDAKLLRNELKKYNTHL